MTQPDNQSEDQAQVPSKVEPEDVTEAKPEAQAKRVIIRLSESDMDYQNPREFVDFCFQKFPSDAALDPTRHFVHYQPPSDFPQSNPKAHIVIDLETSHILKTLAKTSRTKSTKFAAGLVICRQSGFQRVFRDN
jgi:hypothetical protein